MTAPPAPVEAAAVDPVRRPRRGTRLAAVLGVMAMVGVIGLVAVTADDDSDTLTDTTPQALVAGLRTSSAVGFSGTVVSRFTLGVPAAAARMETLDDSSLLAMLEGSHTLQVWYGGADRQRVAVLGATDETDLFRNGRDLWRWDSRQRVAVHSELPAGTRPLLAAAVPRAADATSLTPTGLADTALAAMDADTTVAVRGETVVADRPAYDLVLTPQEHETRIGSVHISVDGVTKVPLAVQVYARGSATAAIDIGFTSIRLVRPAPAYFRFDPPDDATVRESAAAGVPATRVLGSGWTSVLAASGVGPLGLGPFLTRAMTPVAGSWGRGRVLHTELLTVLLTDDQRLFVGAVEPRALYSAAATQR